jgi:hypothetical protein
VGGFGFEVEQAQETLGQEVLGSVVLHVPQPAIRVDPGKRWPELDISIQDVDYPGLIAFLVNLYHVSLTDRTSIVLLTAARRVKISAVQGYTNPAAG